MLPLDSIPGQPSTPVKDVKDDPNDFLGFTGGEIDDALLRQSKWLDVEASYSTAAVAFQAWCHYGRANSLLGSGEKFTSWLFRRKRRLSAPAIA